jgi:hypothetical protein
MPRGVSGKLKAGLCVAAKTRLGFIFSLRRFMREKTAGDLRRRKGQSRNQQKTNERLEGASAKRDFLKTKTDQVRSK